tara:strand:+ start:9533 stop:10543 length:1011 start_codon:yes stop_codon:yes gene_type:complete
MNKKKLRILVVGVGSIGRRHIENFKNYTKNIEIVDISKSRIRECYKKFEFIKASYLSYKEAIEKNKYDAVLICTPPHKHLEIASFTAKNKIHSFIEKPLGMNVKGWDKVIRLNKKNKLINYVAYCHRHINYIKLAKKFLNQKKIGKIISGYIRWGSYLPDWHPYEKYYNFYMAKKNQGGGALMDESHGIDLLRYLVGEVKNVFAIVDTISGLKITSDDNALLTLRMKNNSLFQINFDLHSRFPRVSLEILGTEGNMFIDRINNELSFFNIKNKKWKTLKFSQKDLLKMYKDQANYFLNCIIKKRKADVDIIDGLKTQKIIDLAFLSSKKRKMLQIR